MASLVPCTVCQRHVRRHESACPFCGAPRAPSAGPFPEVVIPRDVARATLFALGLSLAAQACGGKSEGENDPTPSGAGASTGTGSGGSGGSGASGAAAAGGSNSSGIDPGQIAPPYGLGPFYPPETAGSAGSTSLPDAGTSSNSDDAGSGDAGEGDAGD